MCAREVFAKLFRVKFLEPVRVRTVDGSAASVDIHPLVKDLKNPEKQERWHEAIVSSKQPDWLLLSEFQSRGLPLSAWEKLWDRMAVEIEISSPEGWSPIDSWEELSL